ncbi:inner membrane protein [Escherichia coli]|uniref:Inner membrane protein n=1 Tax=Escherichia coli TaxID=562 RepID=A0A377DSL5_ECOLX|nr:inner membrane protein [Escherichia coli]
MLDLFVISLTMSLINRDQILAFYYGTGCVLFRRSGNFDYSLLWNGWTAAYFGMHMSQETPASTTEAAD